MRYQDLGKEYLVFQDKHNVLALAFGELIFYHYGKEKYRWTDTENIYPLTIQALNCKDVAKKAELENRINMSLTCMTFKSLCKQYPEEDK